MCRSIKRLREGRAVAADDEIREAARQFVRKVTGFGKPAPHNQAVFDAAVEDIARASKRALTSLEVRGAGAARDRGGSAGVARPRRGEVSPRRARPSPPASPR